MRRLTAELIEVGAICGGRLTKFGGGGVGTVDRTRTSAYAFRRPSAHDAFDYRLDLTAGCQPAVRASASEQNHRSPRAALIRVSA